MARLANDTAIEERGGKLSATLSRDWEIWGPNGGYIASIALRAAGKVAPPGHRPATFSCQYLSVGQFTPVEIDAEPVRKGRNVWCTNVVVSQNEKRLLQAQVWTTNKQDGPSKTDRKFPDVKHHAELKTWAELFPDGKESFPFWRNFDSKPASLAGRGKADPRGSVNQDWYRFREFTKTDDVFLDFARALVMIDTYPWPAFGRGLDTSPDYVAPTLDVTAWFHTPPGDADWFLADARADVAADGLIHGTVDIWSEDGRAIATGGSNLLVVQRGG
ncbi:MAG TPA: thioesterase family protein [Rhizomicrobium sp.]|nr:thioesterase family protein [Rhizomicrobium sp.]